MSRSVPGFVPKRGPRGDIDQGLILAAADALLRERGAIEEVSLRAVAAEVGVATNTLYTYFPSATHIWRALGDERLGALHPQELLEVECRHCALLELARRAWALAATPGTLSLLQAGPILGPHSFHLSETLLALTADASIDARDAHDLLLAWFYGSMTLAAEGWTAGTDEIRAQSDLADFPLVAGRADPDPGAQLQAILRGIGVGHTGSH